MTAMIPAGPTGSAQRAAVDAALLVLERMGLSPADLLCVRVDLTEAGPGEVVEQVVAVEPGPPHADLHQPGPHRRRRRTYRYRPGRAELGTGHQIIAGHRRGHLGIGCAPAKVPGPVQRSGRNARQIRRDGAYLV